MPRDRTFPRIGGLRRAIGCATALSIMPSAALAETDSTFSEIHARISIPVAVSEIREMSFASMAQPASPGNPTAVSPDNAAGSSLAVAAANASSPATIVITGAPNQTVGLLIADRARLGAKPRTFTVSNFTHNGGKSPALGPDGKATINLGATLQISSGVQYGSYRGAFDVIVSNN